jgi:hypothetical protein
MRYRALLGVSIVVLLMPMTAIVGEGPSAPRVRDSGASAPNQSASTWRELVNELRKPRFGPLHPDTTSRPRHQRAEETLRKLEEETGARWQIWRWSNTTGGANSVMLDSDDLRSGLGDIPGSTPRAKAEYFVNEYWQLFLPMDEGEESAPEFRFLWERSWIVRFQQYSQGLPVFRSWIDVIFFYGSIRSAGGPLHFVPSVNVSPMVSSDDALDAIRRSKYGSEEMRLAYPAELVIYPSKPPRLMWSMQCTTHPTGNYVFSHLLVDAKTGEIFDVKGSAMDVRGEE